MNQCGYYCHCPIRCTLCPPLCRWPPSEVICLVPGQHTRGQRAVRLMPRAVGTLPSAIPLCHTPRFYVVCPVLCGHTFYYLSCPYMSSTFFRISTFLVPRVLVLLFVLKCIVSRCACPVPVHIYVRLPYASVVPHNPCH